jgi:hypothetical protein
VAAEGLLDPLEAAAVAEALAEPLQRRRPRQARIERALRRNDDGIEERGGGDVGDAEMLADEELAVALVELGLDLVEGGDDRRSR